MKIVYIDMDNVLVDFRSAFRYYDKETLDRAGDDADDIPGIFAKMEPMRGAVESFNLITAHFDTFILSTAPWDNPSAWSDKLEWVKRHLGDRAYKRLILTHHKDLNRGDYLIDDREKHGAGKFEGKLLLFAAGHYPDWPAILEHLAEAEGGGSPTFAEKAMELTGRLREKSLS